MIRSILLAPMLVILLIAAAGPGLPVGAPVTATGSETLRLDSQLVEVANVFEERGGGAAEARARELRIDAEGGLVRVIIEAVEPVAASDAVRTMGAEPEGTYQDLVQAAVPLASLKTLARDDSVTFVRPPLRAVPFVTGQGVALLNADDWHAQGVTGAGVKVAVLDLGFDGYESRLGTELPASVTAMSFRADGDIYGDGQPHGTGVAEIVHEMAPGAQMYLANFETEVELAAATVWLTSQGVQAINASWGYFTAGPGDGTGLVNDIVSDSVDAGAFWGVAAGNHALRHWAGTFVDTNANGFHEFTTGTSPDEGNEIAGAFLGLVLAGEEIGTELKWDDPFGAACRDYNLYVMRTDDVGQPLIVGASGNIQNDGASCMPGADPVEAITMTAPVTDVYHLVIRKSVASTNAFLDLYSWAHDIEYRVPSNSLAQPADNPDVATAGAVYQVTPSSIESFSSRGPTRDGRIKPNIVTPDGVSNATYGSFFGTSAAAPHVTGTAALFLDRLPCWTPAENCSGHAVQCCRPRRAGDGQHLRGRPDPPRRGPSGH